MSCPRASFCHSSCSFQATSFVRLISYHRNGGFQKVGSAQRALCRYQFRYSIRCDRVPGKSPSSRCDVFELLLPQTSMLLRPVQCILRLQLSDHSKTSRYLQIYESKILLSWPHRLLGFQNQSKTKVQGENFSVPHIGRS